MNVFRPCRLPRWSASLLALTAAFVAWCAPHSAATPDTPSELPPRALLVGGGPSPDYNPVALESNLRYLHRLLGVKGKGDLSSVTTLFADGNAKTQTVLYQAPYPSRGEELLDWLLEERYAGQGGEQLRARQLSACDGASEKPQITGAIRRFAQVADAQRPLLLYFTGHGGDDEVGHENNFYVLWKDENFTVRELAREMNALPTTQHVALVMVQCYSGSFASLLFGGGDPQGPVIARDFAGFFATTPDRVAAGCTSEVNEAEYHDFTSYFFAALSGRDRVGRKVTGADYDGNGSVGMDEAFAYALIYDESIDVPVRTLDAYVRRFAALSDEQIFEIPYSDVQQWADPAQRAALDALSTRLKLSGESRLRGVLNDLRKGETGEADDTTGAAQLERTYQQARTRLVGQFPALRSRNEDMRSQAETKAARWLNDQFAMEDKAGANAQGAFWTPLLEGIRKANTGGDAKERHEIAISHLLRFARLAKTVVLEHRIATTGAPNVRARMERLLVSERRPLALKSDF